MAAVFKLTWAGITLADSSAGDIISAISLDGQLLVQVGEGLRAAAVTPFNNSNATHVLEFTNKRPPALSPVKATQFLFTHAKAIKDVTGRLNDASLILDDKTWTLKNAVARRNRGGQIGTTDQHSYEVIFGDLTVADTAP